MSDITRSEAIKQLRILKADINNGLAFVSKTQDKHKALESLDMAIASLETDEAYQLEYERTTKNDHHRQNIQAYAHDFGVSEEQAEKELRVTTKNDLGVDCISKADALKLNVYAPIAPIVEGENVHWEEIILTEELRKLPSVLPNVHDNNVGNIEDCISRDLLIRKLNSWDMGTNGIPNYAWKVINELPSVLPKADNSVLEDIRAEIENMLSDGMIHKKTVLGIIDKYRGESEG